MFDFRSNDFDATWQAAISAREAFIHMLAVGIGNNLNQDELEGIASYPVDNNVIRLNNFMSLGDGVDELLDSICNSKIAKFIEAFSKTLWCKNRMLFKFY